MLTWLDLGGHGSKVNPDLVSVSRWCCFQAWLGAVRLPGQRMSSQRSERKRTHACGLRPSSRRSGCDLASDIGERRGSIALKGSSCLMGFLYDADGGGDPSLLLLQHIIQNTHFKCASIRFCPLCTQRKHTHTCTFECPAH